MKTSLNLISLLIAAGIPGVALIEIHPLTTGLFPIQGETLIALFVSAIAVLTITADYARTFRPLITETAVIDRPGLHSQRNTRRIRASGKHAA